ncbi:MAG: hypothetical protein ACQEVT_18755, partial [Pseudomonadota bacterium]
AALLQLSEQRSTEWPARSRYGRSNVIGSFIKSSMHLRQAEGFYIPARFDFGNAKGIFKMQPLRLHFFILSPWRIGTVTQHQQGLNN